MQTRHYTVLGLLGRGSQGNVYHAALQDGTGFRKDVAIKLLKSGLSGESLQRFRDEARILGMVRDRALVWADPPVRMGGRWALVMELAEGQSAGRLLEHCGPLPVSVALEIVAEIARVLTKLLRHRGSDGQPLRLLHRDIKPDNIQITMEGEVKLLDFGIARANFEEREAQTVQHIGGTPGFIAPERLRGIDTPACDIYALGAALRVLLTGEKPVALGTALHVVGPPDLLRAIALADEMRQDDAKLRPFASEVERRARELRDRTAGPTLREWAAEVLPGLRTSLEDPLVGAVLTEDLPAEPGYALASGARAGTPAGIARVAAPVPEVPVGVPWLSQLPAEIDHGLIRKAMAAGLVALALWGTTVGALGFLFGRWWLGTGEVPVEAGLQPRVVPAAEDASPSPSPPTDPTGDGSTLADSRDPPATRQAPVASPEPAHPEPAHPEPAKPEAQPLLVPVAILSVLPAEVWLDDAPMGTTPLDLQVATGRHRLRLITADKTLETTVMMGGRRGATRFHWDGGDSLSAR